MAKAGLGRVRVGVGVRVRVRVKPVVTPSVESTALCAQPSPMRPERGCPRLAEAWGTPMLASGRGWRENGLCGHPASANQRNHSLHGLAGRRGPTGWLVKGWPRLAKAGPGLGQADDAERSREHDR